MKIYERQAEVIKAISSPVRLAILEILNEGDLCVCDIAARVKCERSNVSRHLAVMVNAGILSYRKQGLNVIYSLKTPCVLNFLGCISQVLKDRANEQRKLVRKS